MAKLWDRPVLVLTIALVVPESAVRLCVPQQLDVTLISMETTLTPGANTSITMETNRVLYDATRRKVLVHQLGDEETRYLYDFPAHTLYVITGTTCSRRPLTSQFQEACTPANSSLDMGRSTFGIVGGDSRLAFFYGLKGSTSTGNYFVSISPNNVPVRLEVFGSDQGKVFFRTVNYVNSSALPIDPARLAPPPSCALA